MDIIAALAGNPLPTSIAVLVGICAILGYYFFVIPLTEDHKKLKADYDALTKKFEEKQKEDASVFATQLGDLGYSIQVLREALLEGSAESGEKLKEVEKFISDLNQFHVNFGRNNESLQSQVEILGTAMNRLNDNLTTHIAGSHARDDSIDRLLVEVTRSMSNVNEIQNQILGALLGMGRIQDRNRSI